MIGSVRAAEREGWVSKATRLSATLDLLELEDGRIPVPANLTKTSSCLLSPSLPLSDQCFCKLEGQIDDCSCKVDTVDHFNNAKIYPRLASLLAKDYFRYFYYQPYKPCPFWEASSGKCSSSLCQV